MEVVALDPSAHQELVILLRSMDTVTWVGDGVESMARVERMYGRMVDLLESSTPLARDTTTASGTFTLSVPSADSVLVIADAEMEDTPIYYAYAMLNARSNTDFELDMSIGRCRPPGSILRTAAGLIFQDDFNRANGAPGVNWEIRGNPAFWSIAGNVLKGRPTDATLQQILVANSTFGSARGEMVVQARMRRYGGQRASFPGIHARHDAAGGSWFRWVVTNSSSASKDEFQQTLAGATTILKTSAPYDGSHVWQQFKLAVKDGQQKGWKGNVLAVDLTSPGLNAVTGRAGFSTGWYAATADHHEFDDFAVYTRNTITVRGLPAGFSARVGTRVAAGSGGVATVDLLEDLCSCGAVEVINASGVLAARLTPGGGVWGGDEYIYTP